MADKKISQLNITTTSDDGSWLVMNDSGNTATFRITRQNLLSGTTAFIKGDASQSIVPYYFPTSSGVTTNTTYVDKLFVDGGVEQITNKLYASGTINKIGVFSVGSGNNFTGTKKQPSIIIGHNNTDGTNDTDGRPGVFILGNNCSAASGADNSIINGYYSSSNAKLAGLISADNANNSSQYSVMMAMNYKSSSSSQYSLVGGGYGGSNTNSPNSIIWGGANSNSNFSSGFQLGTNLISNYTEYGYNIGYENDLLGTAGNVNTGSGILGGTGNTINANVDFSSIIGGRDNIIPSSSQNAVIAAASGRTSLYNYTLHTDNIHTFKTETFNVIAVGNVGGNIDVDCSLGTIFTFTMTADTTPNFINLRTGQRFIFIVENTTFAVPGATINGVSGNAYAKNGTINLSNNAITKYTATFDGTRMFLDEELNFTAV